MRKILLVFAVCVCSAVFAENIVLDLSNPGDFLCFRTLLLIPIIQMDSLPAR